MDFDGFLVQMRIEVEGVERAAAPLWDLAVSAEAGQTPSALLSAPIEANNIC